MPRAFAGIDEPQRAEVPGRCPTAGDSARTLRSEAPSKTAQHDAKRQDDVCWDQHPETVPVDPGAESRKPRVETRDRERRNDERNDEGQDAWRCELHSEPR